MSQLGCLHCIFPVFRIFSVPPTLVSVKKNAQTLLENHKTINHTIYQDKSLRIKFLNDITLFDASACLLIYTSPEDLDPLLTENVSSSVRNACGF